MATRLARVIRFLEQRVARGANKSDATITHCIELMRQHAGQVSMDALLTRSGLGVRQLERRFLLEVGLPPRLMANIFRFRRVFDVLDPAASSAARPRWVSAAVEAGFFDQAHMIRDFRRFAGVPPQAFYRELGGLSAAMIGQTGGLN